MSAASESADWVARGRAHQWEGRPVDAMLCFRRASRADPRAPDPHFVLGEVLWQLGRLPEALAAWREAARLDAGVSRAAAGACRSAAGDGRRRDRAVGGRAGVALAPGNARAELIVAHRANDRVRPPRRLLPRRRSERALAARAHARCRGDARGTARARARPRAGVTRAQRG